MAMHVVSDLCKKFRILAALDKGEVKTIVEGVVDGLLENDFPHPLDIPGVPNYLRSMERSYVLAYGVGRGWRRIAKEWPLQQNGEAQATSGGNKL